MLVKHIKFEAPFFDDLPPDEKKSEELMLLLLKEARGDKIDIKKYNDGDINRVIKKLINDGMIHGTIIDYNRCVWSRLTKKGFFYLSLVEADNFDE